MEVFTGRKPFIELTRSELMKIKNQEAFIPIIYSEIVSLLKQKYGNEYTIKRIREMGHRLSDGLLKYWKPKNTKVPDIVKEAYKTFVYRDIKVDKSLEQWIIRDEHCPICYLDISDSDIAFCTVFSAMIEGLINGLRKWLPKLPQIECTTIASRSMGAELCEHAITVKWG